MADDPLVSIVIATRNRKAEVLRALESCFAQRYSEFEVLVFDDASTDGTSDAIASQFPQVRLFCESTCRGYIVLRNRGFHESHGKYIFSIDDDAYYTNPDSIEPVVRLLEQIPRIGAVAMPYTEPGQHKKLLFKGDMTSDVRSYVGCAHAIRRQVVLDLGGYRDFFVHQGEERDLCVRMIDRGFRIAQIDIPPIVHSVSPQRSHLWIERYAIRNTLLFDVINVPIQFVLPRLVIDAVALITWMPNWPMTMYRVYFVLWGLVSCFKYLPRRRPVSSRAYQIYRSLPLHGPLARPLAESESLASTEILSCS